MNRRITAIAVCVLLPYLLFAQVQATEKPAFDYGDAPDQNYRTLHNSNGARHRVVPKIYLGAGVNTELDGQPDKAARTDYDDGVVIFDPLIRGKPHTLTVTASTTGYLSGYMDFNADGDWDYDPGEQIFFDKQIHAGANRLRFFVSHAAVKERPAYARFRFTTQRSGNNGLPPDGEAPDGEVEDYLVMFWNSADSYDPNWKDAYRASTVRRIRPKPPVRTPAPPSVVKPAPQPVPKTVSKPPISASSTDWDFGDAPDENHETLLENNGARHRIAPGFHLGRLVDADEDGQPTHDGRGDDEDGQNDDDGVEFISPLVASRSVHTRVTASAPGYLNAYMDFNADGDWTSDPEERIFYRTSLKVGVNDLYFTIPRMARSGRLVFARFRFTSKPGSRSRGPADDGEVEDYAVVIEKAPAETAQFRPAPISTQAQYDFGDAPELNCQTVYGNQGARHVIVPGFHLGHSVDAELDGQPTPDATGDDADGNDDEDGVIFEGPLQIGSTANVLVIASQPGLLCAWMDFNADGDWTSDPGEKVINNYPVEAGTNRVEISIPLTARIGINTAARFRLYSAPRRSSGIRREAGRKTERWRITRYSSSTYRPLQNRNHRRSKPVRE